MQSYDSVGNLELLCAFVKFPIAVSHPKYTEIIILT